MSILFSLPHGINPHQWGIVAAVLAGAGYVFSPVYRGLTIQFKVYVHCVFDPPITC